MDPLLYLALTLALLALFANPKVFARDANPLVPAFLLVAIAFGFAYFIQMKGWQYHSIPVMGALLTAIVICITSEGMNNIARYPLGVLTLTFVAFLSISAGSYHNWKMSETEAILQSVPRGEAVAVIAADPMFMWPMVDDMGLRWPLKVYSHWMLPAIGNVSIRPSNPALIRPLTATVLTETAGDLRCDPPALILIERQEHNYSISQRRIFDVPGLFLTYNPIRDFIARNYVEEQGTKLFTAFRRIARPPKSCDRTAIL